MSTYERLYLSPLHDPIFFWVAVGILVLLIARRLPFLAGFLVVFAFEIAADALLTGALSPIPKGAWWGTPVSVAFVILGDFRFFLVASVAGKAPTESFFHPVKRAVVWAFVVPVVSYLLRSFVPVLAAPMRVTFLTYELLFFALAITMRALILPRTMRESPLEIRRFVAHLTIFEIVQYGLWATADILILTGFDIGFLLRFLPNTMYYALFLPFVFWRAPAAWRVWQPSPHRV
ncbi:MAG: hypothetical protein IPK82_28650 [Polyangiaceae bacterium]|nr:hypothetical protein [Polyangiaceae bacterium]